jgi:5-methylcytosine-specific restriction endonuclease McrA
MPMRLRTWVIGHYYSGNRCPRCQRSGSSRPELDSYRWKKLRRLVRARDGNRCRNCGATEKLSVHHVVRHGADVPENLLTLCARCHYHAERAV